MRFKPNFTYTAAARLAAELSGQEMNGREGFEPLRTEWFVYTPGSPEMEGRVDASELFLEQLPTMFPETAAKIRRRVEDVLREQPAIAVKVAAKWRLLF